VEVVFSKVAGIDVHKRQVTMAAHVLDVVGTSIGEARAQKVRRFATFLRNITGNGGMASRRAGYARGLEATGVFRGRCLMPWPRPMASKSCCAMPIT
jgi:transposase